MGVASKSDGLPKVADLHLLSAASSRGEVVARTGTDSRQREALRSEADVLLLRVQKGDQDALADLFDKYCRLVFSIGYRVLRCPTEAEDLVQDVFLFLWSRSNLFVPGKRSAHDWIIRVIYHRAFDRRRYLITRLSYNFGNEDGAAGYTNQEPAADRASRVVSKDGNFGELLYWHSYLESAFDELSEAQRKTLTLFYYEGYTLAEISSELGESLMNVRNHYYRGLRRLEAYMDSNGDKD